MAIACVFSGKQTPSTFPFNLTAVTHAGCPNTRTNLLTPRGQKVIAIPNTIYDTRMARCIANHQKKPLMIPKLEATSDSSFEIHSVSDTVQKFYTCINEGDRKGLEDLIGNNCQIEDSSFPYVIQGKKEVMGLFVQLSESMGENVQFKLGTVCEGDNLTASVNWHLEWKDEQIPFSRGCSIFQCSNEGDRLIISKAQIITESPIKPGIFAMAFLKVVTSLFNDFPNAAKWFLKSPHTILKAALTLYSLFFAPIVNPIITFYITLWKFIARTLGYALSFLNILAKFVNKGSTSSTDSNENDTDASTLESDQGPSSLP